MDNINNLVNDVMSGDDERLSYRSSKSSDSDSTVISHDDRILNSLINESETVTKSLLNLNSYQSLISEEKKYERKPWQSALSLKSKNSSNYVQNLRPSGTSGYESGEAGLSFRSNSASLPQCTVQTFNSTSSLLQKLQNELTLRTTELHDKENEYFNLKASYENIRGQFDLVNTDMSALRMQILSKDKQMRQLQQKLVSVEGSATRSYGDCEAMRVELEKTRSQLEDVKQSSDNKYDNLSSEVRRREEIIAQLRSELTQTARTVTRSTEVDNAVKEKNIHLEKTVKQKEQQLQNLLKHNKELEDLTKKMQEEISQKGNTATTVENLEQEIDFIKEQLDNANQRNEALTETMLSSKRFYEEFKVNSDNVMKGHINTIDKIKQDYRELELKHKDCLSTMKQQGDNTQRLVKEIADLTEKIRINDHNYSEQAKQLHTLKLENAESKNLIENFKLQLVDASMTETNLTKTLTNESQSRQSYIDQLSQETIHLNRVIDDLKDKIKIRDETIGKLNEQLVQVSSDKEMSMKTIRNFEEKICSMSFKEKVLDSAMKEKIHQIEIIEAELTTLKDQHKNLLDDYRKINSEKGDAERLMKRKEEKHSQEISEKEDEILSAKTEIEKLNFMNINEKETSTRLILENEQLMREINGLKMKSNEMSEELDDKKNSMEELTDKEQRLQNHNQYLESELSQVKLALDDSIQELEQLKYSWNHREDAIESLKHEAKKNQENNLDLIQKIEQRDQLLQKLSSETTKLKQKYQEKTTENFKLNKENESLKSNVRESEKSLKDLQQKYDSTTRKKDVAIEQLKAQSSDIQSQYKQCYETLLKKEEYLNRIQLLEKDQSTKASQAQKEISRIQADYDEMEAEVNTFRAKHRACQEELSQRDLQINDMRNEIQAQQQDLMELQSERMICQNEIDRWKEKFSEIQKNEMENLEDKISQKDHLNDELQGKLQIANQKIENHEQTMGQLKVDINLARSTNSERNNHFQTIIGSQKNEIENIKQEKQLVEEKCSKYKSQMAKCKSEQESSLQTVASLRNEFDMVNEKLRIKESECQHWMQQTQSAQYLNEEVKLSLDSLEKEITFAKQQIITKDAKLQASSETILKLKEERNQVYKNLMDGKSLMESVNKDRDDIGRLYEENTIKMKKYEQCIKDLNEELSTAQVEISSYINRMSKLESDINHLTMESNHRQSIIEEFESKVAKLKSNHNSYKQQFKTSETEVENLNTLLLQHAKKCAELESKLSILTNEREKFANENNVSQGKIESLVHEVDCRNKELERFRLERDSQLKQLNEKQTKYQHELKKLKLYARQAEEDISLSHKTIDDIQNQLDLKQKECDVISRRSESAEDNLERRNREVSQLELKLSSVENEFQAYRVHRDLNSDKQANLEKEIEDLRLELKDKTQRLFEMTNECTKYQTKVSSLEDQLEKTEKKLSKFESDYKTLNSSFMGYNKEVTELRTQHLNQSDVIEKTKAQYGKFFSEFNLLKEENKKDKKSNLMLSADIENLKIQLNGRIEHQKLLQDQIEEHESLITELQKEIVKERKKNELSQRMEFEKKRSVFSKENESEVLTQMKQELEIKLKEVERTLHSRNQELENCQRQIRNLTETLMDRDNKIKLFDKRLKLADSEINSLRENISKMECISSSSEIQTDRKSDYIGDLQSTIDEYKKQISNLQSKLQQTQSEKSQLRITCENKEEEKERLICEIDRLQKKYSELASNKDESMTIVNWKTNCLVEENESLHQTITRLKLEVKERDEILLKNYDQKVKNLTQRLIKYQNDEIAVESQLRQMKNEVQYQNDQFVTMKQKYDKMCSENSSFQEELKESKEIIENLKQENGGIVENFNSWIQEQKAANEKLGDKIREQNRTIQELKKDKNNLEREKVILIHEIHENGRTTSQIDSASSWESDLFKEKNNLIENLQTKIREQINEIVHLKERILTLELCQNTGTNKPELAELSAESYRTYNEGQKERKSIIKGQLGSSKSLSGSSYLQQVNEVEHDTHDKKYWIKRVGELSEELQQSREYWLNKVQEISINPDLSTVTDETVTTPSS